MVSEKWSKNSELLRDSNAKNLEYGAVTLANTPRKGPMVLFQVNKVIRVWSLLRVLFSGERPQCNPVGCKLWSEFEDGIYRGSPTVSDLGSLWKRRLCTGRVVCKRNSYGLTISPTRWPRPDLSRQDSRHTQSRWLRHKDFDLSKSEFCYIFPLTKIFHRMLCVENMEIWLTFTSIIL